jgi:hypothetical protein
MTKNYTELKQAVVLTLQKLAKLEDVKAHLNAMNSDQALDQETKNTSPIWDERDEAFNAWTKASRMMVSFATAANVPHEILYGSTEREQDIATWIEEQENPTSVIETVTESEVVMTAQVSNTENIPQEVQANINSEV